MFTILIATNPLKSRAQGYAEGANLSGDVMPLSVKGTGGTQSFNGISKKLTDNIPVYLKKHEHSFLVFGLNLEAMSFSGTHNYFPVDAEYGITPMFGYSRTMNKKLNVSALLVPLLNSDLKVLNSTDFHFGAVVKAVYWLRPNVSVKVTLGYRRQYYGTQYVVLLGGDWKISNRWRLFGDLPNNATLAYAISPKMNTGLIYQAGNTTYSLSQQNSYLLYDYAQGGLFLEYYLTKYIALRGTFTTSVIRKLDIFNANQQVAGGVLDYIPMSAAPKALNNEVSNGPALKLSLSARKPDKK